MSDREFPIRINIDRRYVTEAMAAKIAASRVPAMPPDLELLRYRLRYCPGVEIVHGDDRPECPDGGCDGGQLHAWLYRCDCCVRR